MSDDVLAKDEWLERVLGVSVPRPTPSKTEKNVRFARKVTVISGLPKGGNQGVDLRRARRDVPINVQPQPEPDEYVGPKGVSLRVGKTTNGRTVYTAPPPPVGEITFSGGGGKGAALPGAVKSLEKSGVLKETKKIAGASVGSMTAALVAAGITGDEFADIGNADSTTEVIVEGTGGTLKGMLWTAMKGKVTGKGGHMLTGDGLEKIVGKVLDETLRKRLTEYMRQCANAGEDPNEDVSRVAEELTKSKDGPTFGQLSVLSKHIPAIKEVVITGTYLTEFEKVQVPEKDKGKSKDKDKARVKFKPPQEGEEDVEYTVQPVKGGNEEGQLYVFDANSEPDMPIAWAVHASASFPAVFKPVDLELSTGMVVRFIDGGVMNNTPTSSSLGNERKLDPVPQERGMTFVFEDADTSGDLVKGKVNPSQGTGALLKDWFMDSSHGAGEYAKNKDLADRPEEIVVVPMQVELPPKKKGGKVRKIDMRGMLDGTLNFTLDLEAKLKLQEETEKATNQQIEREKQPKTREFASDSQMFVSIPLNELQILSNNGFPGAAKAVTFRKRVGEMITKLKDAVKKANSEDVPLRSLLNDKDVMMALDELDTQAGDDIDFQGYAARELNKQMDLDLFMDVVRKSGKKSPTMEASYAVTDALKVKGQADHILKMLVYPKMKREPKGGAGILTLLTIEQLMRKALLPTDVNQAITLGVDHFKNKSDRSVPKRGHKKFAKELDRRRMPV